MATQSEQFEEQARRARTRLSETLEALRTRMTPRQVVDQLADYASRGPAAEFFHNLAREARENPLPLTLIGVGVAWLIIASGLSSRTRVENAARRQAAYEERPNELSGRSVAISPEANRDTLDETATALAVAAEATREPHSDAARVMEPSP
jgi:Protein of unknown function (DUF3618)